jgi:hypothetical protein
MMDEQMFFGMVDHDLLHLEGVAMPSPRSDQSGAVSSVWGEVLHLRDRNSGARKHEAVCLRMGRSSDMGLFLWCPRVFFYEVHGNKLAPLVVTHTHNKRELSMHKWIYKDFLFH